MGNPNCCFMIIAGTFFSPANRRGELWFAQKPSNGGKFQTKAITTVRAGLGGQGNCNT